MLRKVAFKVFYLGTAYHGFQMQPKHNSVEEEIKSSLIKTKYVKFDDYGNFNYCSRTDSGVHAIEQIITFETEKKIIIPEINQNLPKDIIFWAHTEVNSEYNPRYNVISRHYKYIFAKDYKHYDLDSMKKATKLFIGKHDFRNFSKFEPKKNPIREILKLEVNEVENCFVFDMIGTSFLRQMVRKVARAILEIGLSQISIEKIEELLNNSNSANKKIGPAPLEPYGSLILYKIENDHDFIIDQYSQERIRRLLKNKIREHVLKKNSLDFLLKKID